MSWYACIAGKHFFKEVFSEISLVPWFLAGGCWIDINLESPLLVIIKNAGLSCFHIGIFYVQSIVYPTFYLSASLRSLLICGPTLCMYVYGCAPPP